MLWQKVLGATVPSTTGATVTYVGGSNNTNNLSSYTFSSISIGGPGLIVFVAGAESDSGSAFSLSSLTVDGADATIHSSGAGVSLAVVASFRVISGTTASVVVTFSATASRMRLGVFRIQDNYSDSPVQQLTNYSASNRTSASLAFTASGQAVGVIGVTTSVGSTAFTWTNATERYDVVLGSGTVASAATRDMTTAAVTVTAANGRSGLIYMSGALWR